MNLTLPLASSLLQPSSHLALSAQETAPNLPAAEASSPEGRDDAIIRQYSIYTGLRAVYTLQQSPLKMAAMTPSDPVIIRRSALKRLGTPIDGQRLEEESKHLETLYMTALREEEAKSDKTFMQENAKRPGVVSLPIGIQYKVIPDPEGNNRTLDEMNGYMGQTSSGRCFAGISSAESSGFSDVLPNILTNTSALQNMPKGKEFIFYIPVELLSPSKRKDVDSNSSIIIYTFFHQKAGDSFWIPNETPAQAASQKIPADLLRQYSELQGARIAQFIQSRWTGNINPAIVKQTIFDHIKDTIDPEALRNKYENIIRQHAAMQAKREKEHDEAFLQENSRKPGVSVLGNGIQYTVEKDPGDGNRPFTQAIVTNISSISGTKNDRPWKNDHNGIEDSGIPDMLGESLKQIEPGRKWTLYLPFRLLPNIKRQSLTFLWGDACPEYVVLSCETDSKEPTSSDQDEDIEDGTLEKNLPFEEFWKRKDRSPETMARDEEHFLRLLALTPNVTVLPNGVRYSCLIDPDGQNSSIRKVSIMTPSTLTGDSFGSHIHLNFFFNF